VQVAVNEKFSVVFLIVKPLFYRKSLAMYVPVISNYRYQYHGTMVHIIAREEEQYESLIGHGPTIYQYTKIP
jgi:hypothetical protein